MGLNGSGCMGRIRTDGLINLNNHENSHYQWTEFESDGSEGT